MRKLIKKGTHKRGLAPGTLVHTGERKTEKVRITVFDYDADSYREQQVDSVEECLVFKDRPSVTWINIDGLHQVEVLEQLGRAFGLHPLVLEDILHTEQRPKAEDYGDYYYLVARMFHEKETELDLKAEQISLILGSNFVISFQEREGDVFDPVRERIRTGKGRVRKMGADYLAYALLDAIVDSYFVNLESIADRIESVEDELIDSPSPRTLQALYRLKSETLYFRKLIRPLRELVGALEREESPLLSKDLKVFLRDLYDHTVQVIDTVETLREMLMGMLDIYLSSISNRMNAVMKVLTIIATIFIPLTFIAGVYGMNFDYMPELHWRWGYLTVLLVMGAIFVGMLIYFRRKDWI